MLHKRTSAVVPLPCGWSWLNVFLTNQGNFFVQTVVKPTIKSYAIQINALTVEVVYQYYFLKNSVPIKKYYISVAVSVNLLSLHCADCVLDIRNSSGTNDVPRTVLLNISTTTYTCYVAPATFDNNKSDDSDITRGARMQNRHIVQQQGGVRTTYTMRAAAELSFVVRPMIDGLHYKLATIGTPSPKRARKKTSSIFQS